MSKITRCRFRQSHERMSHGHGAGSYLWTRAVGPEIISPLLWAIVSSEEHTFKTLVVEQFDRVAVDHTDHVTRDRPAMADPANQTMKRAVKRPHASKLVMPWRGNHDRGSVTREECDFRHRVAGVSPYPSWTGLKIPRQSIPA